MKGYKRYFAFAVILGLICSVLYNPIPAYASDLIDDLVYYALSVSGYMETELSFSGGGGGHSFGKPVNEGSKIKSGENKDKGLLSTLREAFQNAYDNHNISTDDNGNYIFDETITNNFYNIINGGVGVGGYNAKYISNYSPDLSMYNAYVTEGMIEAINNLSFDKYFIQYDFIERSNAKFPIAIIYDLSEVDYLYYTPNSNGQFSFTSLEGLSSVQGFIIYEATYNGVHNDLYNTSISSPTVGYTQIRLRHPASYGFWYYSPEMHYDNIPDSYIYSNIPLIFGADETNGRLAYLYMQNPSGVVTNTYNIFPSVSGDQVNNTNWQNCYNSYVNNVNNTYNENHTEWNTDDFIGVMNTQNNLIIESLNKGVADITGAVETLNEKVQRVLDTIKEIKEIIANGGSGGSSGGGGSSFSEEQITQLLNDVKILSENQVTTTTFDETLNTVNEYLKQISDNTENNHDDLIGLKNNLEKLYNFLLYGDNEKGFDSPYDLIKSLYETVATLSGEISIIKNDNSQLALTTADILQKLKDISEKETKDYTTKLNDLLATIDLINDNLNQYTEDEMLEIQTQGEALETIRRFVSDLVDDNDIIMESLGDIELNTRNLEGLLLDIKKNTEGLKKRDIDIDFNPDVDFQYPDKVQNLIDTFIDEALQTAMQGAVPICFLTALGVLIDMLSVEPVAPDFTIPFAVSGTSFGASIGQSVSDYEVNIDLSEWEKPHQLVENLYCILFILLLIYMTFRLVKWAVSVFG